MSQIPITKVCYFCQHLWPISAKKQTKAKKKKKRLTTLGVKCALAATIADVENGCRV